MVDRRVARVPERAARGCRAISGYPTSVTDVLGLIGIAAFIAVMLALSAGVTWLVVRLSPSPANKKN